jgi:CheY-like chemotaxis protein
MIHVLIIDDDDDLRDSLQGLLEEDGVRATTAAGGLSALRQLAGADLPDVILLDLMMPGIDGWELRRRLLADPRLAGIPVIAMTAGRTRPDELEVQAFLHKPFDFDELLSWITMLSERRTTA